MIQPSLPRHLPVLLLLATTVPLAAQTTVSLPCSRDNTLYESSTGSSSNALGTSLFVGVTGQATDALRRGLVRFDVASGLPAGARILSASLTISVAQTNAAAPVPVEIHRLSRDWGEGTSAALGHGGSGAATTAGDATWIHTFSPGGLWTTPGGDFATLASCTFAAATFGPSSSASTLAMVADVQDWLDHPAQNFGWLLKSDELTPFTALRIASRESGPSGPSLQITYVAPGQATSWGTGCLVAGQPFACNMVGSPVGGNTVQITETNGPAGQLAVDFVSLGYDLGGFPLHPQCSLYLPLGPGIVTYGFVLLGAGGTGSAPVTLPTGYPGFTMAWQAAAIDSNPQGFVLSNAVISVLQ